MPADGKEPFSTVSQTLGIGDIADEVQGDASPGDATAAMAMP